MRERRSFAERTRVLKSSDVRVKYFLVFEGSETEEIYFDAINARKNDLGIAPIIELIPLIRDFGELGWSNPKKIVDRIIDNVAESVTGEMTYDILLNRIMDYMTETGIVVGHTQGRTCWNTLKLLCENELHKQMSDIVDDIDYSSQRLVELLVENSSISSISGNITEVIKSLSFTYDSEIDHICIIVDRDKESFVVNDRINQYQYVIDACKNNGFELYVTNPCFEFWLLLHFDDVTSLDKKLLLENKNVTSKKKYAEYELCQRMRFAKNRYDAEELVNSLSKAIHNETMYCEDVELLENNVGSNLGLFFSIIISGEAV